MERLVCVKKDLNSSKLDYERRLFILIMIFICLRNFIYDIGYSEAVFVE